jgi:hypothetical protein
MGVEDGTSRLFWTYDYSHGPPDADSIQEIPYQTSNYGAEFGQAGSVVVNMMMKSGTNQYHGTDCDYFRQRRSERVRSVHQQHQRYRSDSAEKPPQRFRRHTGWSRRHS